MAKIKKLKENGGTIYPATILDAVVDPSTNRKLSNTAIRYFTGGVSLYYKFMSFDIGGDKGMIRFGIVSPLLGYGEFMINWGWQGATEEKHCNPYCVFSTGSQMYNRVKLVRTGGSTFDAYFASNSGNDYATFVFMGQSGTSVKSFSASGVSSIPTAYRESAYVGNICFGTVTGTLAGTADKAAGISFANSDDAINIDNYPQADYGVIPIWLNTAEADGYPPGREGLVFQAKYRSEQGSSGTEYVDCLTQFYVGNEGVRHRTIVDYDEATKFENTSWSKINDDWYFNLGAATVASSTSSSAGVTFTGSSAFSSIRTLLNGLSLTTMSNAMPNISLGFSLTTGSGITHYIRTKVASITRVSNGNYALFAIYQNPSFGDENYVNVLRIVISPSSYSCHTLKSL